VLDPIETKERDAFDAMKFRLPPVLTRTVLGLQPFPRRGESCPMLALPRQRVGYAIKAIGTIPHRKAAGQPLPEAGDGVLERPLRAQSSTAQEARLHQKPKPLVGCQRLGGADPFERQLRVATIKVQRRVAKQC